MPTAQTIIDEAKLDFPDETDTRALSDLQTIDDHLCFRFPLVWSREDVSLTAGTQEYNLPSLTNRVFSARYVTSATASQDLTARHRDWLDSYEPGWRDRASGTPQDFYVDMPNGKLGLHPKPDTTTSTYPKVTVDVSKRRTLLVSTDMGSTLPSYQAWVEGVRYRMALRTGDPRLDVYLRMFRHETAQLDLMMKGAADFHPSVRMETPLTQHRRRV